MSAPLAKILKNLSLAIAATAILTACIIVDVHSSETPGHRAGHATINADVDVAENSKTGDVSSINGDIKIAKGAFVENVEAVNGDIVLLPDASAHDVESVNGDIELHPGSRVRGSIEKVNGDLELNNAHVAKDIEQANGELSLRDSTVAGDVTIAQVDLTLDGSSRILGNVRVEENSRHKSRPVITLGAGSEIAGTLILKRDVELRQHPDAHVGAIDRRY